MHIRLVFISLAWWGVCRGAAGTPAGCGAGGQPQRPLPSLAGAGDGAGLGTLTDCRSCPHLRSPVTARRSSRGAETLHRGRAAAAAIRTGWCWHSLPGDAAAGCYLGLQAQGGGREAAMPCSPVCRIWCVVGLLGSAGGRPPVGVWVLPPPLSAWL